jgi:hypothetical protein
MGAKRDSERFIAADPDGNPEVIDVARDPINLRCESDRYASYMDELSMP